MSLKARGGLARNELECKRLRADARARREANANNSGKPA